MKIVYYVFLFVIALLGITFAGLNAATVSLNLYLTSWSLPLSLLLVLTFGLGLLFGFLVALAPYLRCKKQNYRLKGQVRLAQQEVENLRAIPVDDNH